MNVPLVSLIFLKRSLVFPFLLFSFISLQWSLRKAFLCILAILWKSPFSGISFLFSFAFHFSSFLSYLEGLLRQPFCLFCISFSCGWFWLPPSVQSHEPPSIVLQALCLSDLIPWIYFSLLLYNHKGLDLGQTCTVYWFFYFLLSFRGVSSRRSCRSS